MKLAFTILGLMIINGIFVSTASAQWWVGGRSYALQVDKYDSFYGEARPILWSCQMPHRSPLFGPFTPKRRDCLECNQGCQHNDSCQQCQRAVEHHQLQPIREQPQPATKPQPVIHSDPSANKRTILPAEISSHDHDLLHRLIQYQK